MHIKATEITKRFIFKKSSVPRMMCAEYFPMYGSSENKYFGSSQYIFNLSENILSIKVFDIFKDNGLSIKLHFISYTPIKIDCSFRKLLKRIPFCYTSNVVYKISCAWGH